MKPNKHWIKYLPLALMLACAALFLLAGAGLGTEDLLRWSPADPWLAALFLVGLYGVKSMTVFFPLAALYLAGGLLFPLPAALAVNLTGLTVCAAAPYLVGRCSAADTLARLREKYPKLSALEGLRRENHFLFAVLARSVGVLPGDVVSLYFGAARLPFLPYLAGSLLGLAPTMAAVSIMGSSSPFSPAFLIAGGCDLVLAAGSLLICRRMLRMREK